jgi:hypothetical protein
MPIAAAYGSHRTASITKLSGYGGLHLPITISYRRATPPI